MKERRRLKYGVLFLGAVFLMNSGLHAQRPAMAKNLDIHVENNQAIITFNIKYKYPNESHSVDLQFLDEDYRMITPNMVTGDVGNGINGLGTKSITWAIGNDMELLGGEIRPVIFIDGKSKQFNKLGGPKNAFLSILVPGLGDYFVAEPALMTIKPYVRTISSLGLIGLGAYLGTLRYQEEGYYEKTLKPNPQWYPEEDKFYDRYIEGDMVYPLFKGDKEVFITLGAAIWAADVIWVLARGSNNRKFARSMQKESNFHLGYVPGGASLNYVLTF